jgi:hypothetical protein
VSQSKSASHLFCPHSNSAKHILHTCGVDRLFLHNKLVFAHGVLTSVIMPFCASSTNIFRICQIYLQEMLQMLHQLPWRKQEGYVYSLPMQHLMNNELHQYRGSRPGTMPTCGVICLLIACKIFRMHESAIFVRFEVTFRPPCIACGALSKAQRNDCGVTNANLCTCND